MGFIIAGFVLALLGGGLIWGRISAKNKLYDIQTVETRTAQELSEMAGEIAKEIGPGSFNELTEVKGVVETAAPLRSEIQGESCVYYETRVTRRWEETYWETDNEGKQVQKTRTGEDTVANNTQAIDFLVRDQTGTITVHPTGASFDPVQIVDRFEPGEAQRGVISLGGFSLSLSANGMGGSRRTLGYCYNEKAVPVGRRVYVLGEATDGSGQLWVQKPSDPKRRFIISLKTEEELIAGTKAALTYYLVGAIASFAIGGGLLIAGIVSLIAR